MESELYAARLMNVFERSDIVPLRSLSHAFSAESGKTESGSKPGKRVKLLGLPHIKTTLFSSDSWTGNATVS